MQSAGVTPDIPVTDVWNVGDLNRVTIRAYKNLHQDGQIAIRFPIRVKRGTITINYLSQLPEDWIRQTISETAAHGRALLEAERDKMAARLEMLLDAAAPSAAHPAGREDLLPQIQAAQTRYMEIHSILEI
jgi:hypothetical protein